MADDDGQKKRHAPWSPDRASHPQKKTRDGMVFPERRERSPNKETPIGFPLASPETLKQREMVKIVRKKGGGKGDEVTKFTMIKMKIRPFHLCQVQ